VHQDEHYGPGALHHPKLVHVKVQGVLIYQMLSVRTVTAKDLDVKVEVFFLLRFTSTVTGPLNIADNCGALRRRY
jgi:hypothetical protein